MSRHNSSRRSRHGKSPLKDTWRSCDVEARLPTDDPSDYNIAQSWPQQSQYPSSILQAVNTNFSYYHNFADTSRNLQEPSSASDSTHYTTAFSYHSVTGSYEYNSGEELLSRGVPNLVTSSATRRNTRGWNQQSQDFSVGGDSGDDETRPSLWNQSEGFSYDEQPELAESELDYMPDGLSAVHNERTESVQYAEVALTAGISLVWKPWTKDYDTALNHTFHSANFIPTWTLTSEYWDEQPDSYTSRSVWNPRGLRYNCFYVCIGWLRNMSADEVVLRMQKRFRPVQDKPVPRRDLPLILKSIGGLRMVAFDPSNNGLYSMQPERQRFYAMRTLMQQGSQHQTQPFALGYRRPDGNGHFVIAKMKSGPRVDPRPRGDWEWERYSFTDYQKHSDGEDKTKEIMQSYLMYAIFNDSGISDRKVHITYCEQPVGDVVNCSEVVYG